MWDWWFLYSGRDLVVSLGSQLPTSVYLSSWDGQQPQKEILQSPAWRWWARSMFSNQVAGGGKEVSPFSTQTPCNPHVHEIVPLTWLCLIPQFRACSASPELHASDKVGQKGLHLKDRVRESRGLFIDLLYATSKQFCSQGYPCPHPQRQPLPPRADLSCSSTSTWLNSWLCLLWACSPTSVIH